jgi:putative ABC transport system substrate-binding protein
VFEMGNDPDQLGLVASLNRPGGNTTGVAQMATEVAPKRLELLHEMIPNARTIALLVDPTDSIISKIRHVESKRPLKLWGWRSML